MTRLHCLAQGAWICGTGATLEDGRMVKLMANICSCCLSNMLMLIVQQVFFYTSTAGKFDETQPGLLFGEIDPNPKAELTNVDLSLAGTLDFKTN